MNKQRAKLAADQILQKLNDGMNKHHVELTPDQLLEKFNDGGWILAGGRKMREAGLKWPSPSLPLVEMLLVDETLTVKAIDHSFEFEVTGNDIILTKPWNIEIRQVYMRRQQRKKVDGGGWHEVPAMGVALRFYNPTLREAIEKEQQELAQREKAEREHLQAVSIETARQEFVTKLTQDHVGKRLTEINVDSDGCLYLKFEDGSDISIELDGGDLYDVWINVNGISLDTFKPSEL